MLKGIEWFNFDINALKILIGKEANTSICYFCNNYYYSRLLEIM